MEIRHIGSLKVSLVGLGCNNFGRRLDADASERVVLSALDAGITFFDTADVYGGTLSEEYIGKALKKGRRNEAILATKFGLKIDDDRPGGAKPAYIRKAVEDSLRRLGTDRIDLYQLHRPDPETPIEDTLGALDELVKAGKVREIGCSEMDVPQLAEARERVKPDAAHFVSVQNEFSLMQREPEKGVLAECSRQNIGFIPYFPLAMGLLSGKFRKGQPVPEGTRISSGGWGGRDVLTEDNLNIVESLIQYAESRGHTLLDLAFSWLAKHPQVSSIIAGASNPEQISGNAKAADWKMTDEEFQEVSNLLTKEGILA